MRHILAFLLLAGGLLGAEDDYLKLTAKQAAAIANTQRVGGQVGGSLDLRVISTDRSYNYKLRATWMTPDVIRAVARLQQITHGLSDADTRKLITDAERAGDTVLMVELHGREGSGVIPSDWRAKLGPVGASAEPARNVWGTNSPNLRGIPALAGAARRDYAYDVFWMIFPLRTEAGAPLFGPADSEAELTVQVFDKVGRVRWKIPSSIRDQIHH